MRRPLPTLSRRISSAFTRPLWATALAAASALLPSAAAASFVVFEGAGAGPAAITSIRDSFRSAVGGGSAAGANGDFGGLRREINWDGVPAGFSDPNALPGNFFNVNSPRGAVFSAVIEPSGGRMVLGGEAIYDDGWKIPDPRDRALLVRQHRAPDRHAVQRRGGRSAGPGAQAHVHGHEA